MAKLNEATTTITKPATEGAFKRKKAVTLPSFVIKKEGDKRYFKFITAMRKSDVITKDKDGKEQEAATVANVVDLESGQEGIYLVNSVVHENLIKAYTEDSYVGKAFEIEHTGKREGKRYSNFSVYEVEA